MIDDAEVTQQRDLRAEQLAELNRRLQDMLVELLPERLEDPEWYLTGVQVGLDSLRRLYDSSRMVYKGWNDGSPGAQKVDNLRDVYEQLEKFEKSKTTGRRSKIFLENKEKFERLLMDFEEGERKSSGIAAERLTIIEQVAKDLKIATNTVRGQGNLLTALEGIRKTPSLMKKTRAKKVQELIEGYGQLLEMMGWDDPTLYDTKRDIIGKERRIRDDIKRTRRHLDAVRDQMFKGRRNQAQSENPEDDLDPKKVIPFLKQTSSEGLEFLKRAYSVYSDAAEKREDGLDLLKQIRDLKEEIELLEIQRLQRDSKKPRARKRS